MYIVQVHIHINMKYLNEFIEATLENASNSVKEPGIVRFDVLQQSDDPTRFVLLEVYKTAEDQLKHRETAHYLKWRDAVVDWMEEPRVGVKYKNLYPDDAGWE